MSTDTATLPEGVIRNPGNANHFMALNPIPRTIKVFHGEPLLARSARAIRVMETGKSVYDPVIYIPLADIWAPLEEVERTTHCPLKGDASYFTLDGEELAWGYDKALEFAAALKGHRAFWPDKVRVVEGD